MSSRTAWGTVVEEFFYSIMIIYVAKNKEMDLSNIQMSQVARMGGLTVQVAREDVVRQLMEAGIPVKVVGVANGPNVQRAVTEARRLAENRNRSKVYGRGMQLVHGIRRPKYGPSPTFKRRITDTWTVHRGTGPAEIEIGRNLYKRTIRKIQTGREDELRMELQNLVVVIVKDLESIHRKVHRIQYITNELYNPEEKDPGIFKAHVDESKLAECFAQLVRKYMVDEKSWTLEGKCDPVTLAAYLFMLVEYEGLGGNAFSTRGKKDFFAYLKEEKVLEPEETDRTFRNRLRSLENLRDKLACRPDEDVLGMLKRTSLHYRNFHSLLETFHNFPYYAELTEEQD